MASAPTQRLSAWTAVVAALFVSIVACEKRPLGPAGEREAARPDLYTSHQFSARVVDAGTAKPIEGAAVVVIWRRVDTLINSWSGTFRWFETKTDPDGTFVVPRWGPRWLDRVHYLDARDPEIWILKRGYLLGYFDNTGALDPAVFRKEPFPASISKRSPNEINWKHPHEYLRGAEGSSAWAGRTLMLTRASSDEESARSLSVAAPLDPREPVTIEIPLFSAEWAASRNELDPRWANLEQPLPHHRRGEAVRRR